MGWALRSSAGKGLGLGGLLFFTVFWCAITGVFVGFLARTYLRSQDAQRRYTATDGVVLASEVQTSSGSEGGTTYKPKIRYRYTVNGQSYESDRYSFGEMSSSEGQRHAAEVVRQHPPGQKITVFYDPRKPSEAVLSRSVPAGMLFLLLFLQPFILVGLGMLAACIRYPFARRAERRFQAAAASLPWRIPGWGKLRQEFDGLVLQPRVSPQTVLFAAALGYGLSCFAAIFVVGFLFGGFGEPKGGAVGGALGVAALIGAGAAGYSVRRTAQKARLTLDTAKQRVVLTSPQRQVAVPFQDIAAWQVTSIANPRSVRQEGAPLFVPLLALRTTVGVEVPVHVFPADAQAPEVANRVAAAFAQWTGRPAVAAPTEDPTTTLSMAELIATAKLAVQQGAAQAKALRDLT